MADWSPWGPPPKQDIPVSFFKFTKRGYEVALPNGRLLYIDYLYTTPTVLVQYDRWVSNGVTEEHPTFEQIQWAVGQLFGFEVRISDRGNGFFRYQRKL